MDVTRIANQLGEVGRNLQTGRPGSPVGGALGTVDGTRGGVGGATDDKGSFGEVLKQSIRQVNDLQHAADAAIKDMAVGGPTSLHDTMIALEKAETSFKLMMQVRNKIVDAYHEVLRMQV